MSTYSKLMPLLRLYQKAVHILLWPLFFVLERFTNIRIIDMPFGIGELSMDMELFMKEEILGHRPRFFSIAFIPMHNPEKLWKSGVNLYLLSLYESYLSLPIRVHNRVLLELVRPLMLPHRLRYSPDTYEVLSRFVKVVHDWGTRPPALSLPGADLERGRRMLEAMGIPRDAWFVCIHARELSTKPAKTYHNFRDVNIDTYTLACEEIIRRGGWVIRMGDPAMRAYRPFDRVIDYIHSEYHSDFMDIFLSSQCRFFLGCNSGLAAVPTTFNVPLATTNGVPIAPLTYRDFDIGIIKTAWSDKDQRLVPFAELLEPGYRSMQTQERLTERGWRLIDNTSEEILDLTREMLDSIEKPDAEPDPGDEARQSAFRSLLHPVFHFAYGTRARMSKAFLAKYSALLPDVKQS